MGSPIEVIPVCEKLLELHQNGHITFAGVVSQPARPAGRKRHMKDPAVAEWAKQNQIELIQPLRASSSEFLERLASMNIDVIITAAYGQILSDDFLKVPKRATINIHPSLLPKYRGASPVQTALYDGLTETGVSILFTVKKLDAGAIICQKKSDILSLETADQLMNRLFRLGAEALTDALDLLKDPQFKGDKQEEELVSHCHKFEKNSGLIDWSLTTEEIIHRFQALYPWPGTFSFVSGKRLVVESLNRVESFESDLQVREFSYDKKKRKLMVRTIDGYLELEKVKPEGSKIQTGESFWNGLKLSGKGTFDEG